MNKKIVDLTNENNQSNNNILNEANGFWKSFGQAILQNTTFLKKLIDEFKSEYGNEEIRFPTQKELDAIDNQYKDTFNGKAFFKDLLKVNAEQLTKENDSIIAGVIPKQKECRVDIKIEDLKQKYPELIPVIVRKGTKDDTVEENGEKKQLEFVPTDEVKKIAHKSNDKKKLVFTFKDFAIDEDAEEAVNEEELEEIEKEQSDEQVNASEMTQEDKDNMIDAIQNDQNFESLEINETKGNGFKANHKCTECGNTLDKCTCKIDGLEDEDNKVIEERIEMIDVDGDVTLEELIDEVNPSIEVETFDKFKEYARNAVPESKKEKVEQYIEFLTDQIKATDNSIVISKPEFEIGKFFSGSMKEKFINGNEVTVYASRHTGELCCVTTLDNKYIIFNTRENAYDFFNDVTYSMINNGRLPEVEVFEESFELNVPVLSMEQLNEDFGSGCATQVSNVGQHKIGIITGDEKMKEIKNATEEPKDNKYKGYKVMVSKYFPDEYEIYLEEDLIWGDVGTIEDGYAWLDNNM